jgi:hypothetical protein
LDGYLACCTENVELLAPMAGAEYLGADGIRQFFTAIEDAGPDFRIEVQRVQGIGDSNALAFVRVSSTGRASGIVTGAERAKVYDFMTARSVASGSSSTAMRPQSRGLRAAEVVAVGLSTRKASS